MSPATINNLAGAKKAGNSMCYLCGLPESDTRDHVPPKALFLKGSLKNALTLPCHKSCNGSYSLDEEYFRDNISALYAPNYEANVQVVWKKAFRSLGRRPAKATDMRNRLGKAVALYAADGNFVGRTSEFRFDMARTNRILRKIAQGLLFFHIARPVDDGCSVDVYFHSDARAKPTRENTAMDYMQHAQFKGGWPPTFQYAGLVSQGQVASIWWLLFYRAHLGIVAFDFGGASGSETTHTSDDGQV